MTNILFLCTGNSARSILAEAALNHLGGSSYCGYSAGSDPTGTIQPLALKTLQANGIDTTGLSSKSWDNFIGSGAASIQIIITLCADAAGKACPVWLGDGIRCHWGLPDPAAVEGDEHSRELVFKHTLDKLNNRITALLQLDSDLFFKSNNQQQLQMQLEHIHQQALINE